MGAFHCRGLAESVAQHLTHRFAEKCASAYRRCGCPSLRGNRRGDGATWLAASTAGMRSLPIARITDPNHWHASTKKKKKKKKNTLCLFHRLKKKKKKKKKK